MELVTLGANGHSTFPIPPAAINPETVVQHLTDLLEVTLGASSEDLQRYDSLLSPSRKQDTLQRCTRFASESQVALYVQKDLVESESNGIEARDSSLNGEDQLSKIHVPQLRSK